MPSATLPSPHCPDDDMMQTAVNTPKAAHKSERVQAEEGDEEMAMINCMVQLQEDMTPYDQEFSDWIHGSITGSDVHNHHVHAPLLGAPVQPPSRPDVPVPMPGSPITAPSLPGHRRKADVDELLIGLRVLPASRQGIALRTRECKKAIKRVRKRYTKLLNRGPRPSKLGRHSFSAAPRAALAASPPTTSPESTQFALPISPLSGARSPSPLSAVTSALCRSSPAACAIAEAAPADPAPALGQFCDLEMHDDAAAAAAPHTPRSKRCRKGEGAPLDHCLKRRK